MSKSGVSVKQSPTMAMKHLNVDGASGGVGVDIGGHQRWQRLVDRERTLVEQSASGGSLTSTPVQQRLRSRNILSTADTQLNLVLQLKIQSVQSMPENF
jgi:hypothetical protein